MPSAISRRRPLAQTQPSHQQPLSSTVTSADSTFMVNATMQQLADISVVSVGPYSDFVVSIATWWTCRNFIDYQINQLN